MEHLTTYTLPHPSGCADDALVHGKAERGLEASRAGPLTRPSALPRSCLLHVRVCRWVRVPVHTAFQSPLA